MVRFLLAFTLVLFGSLTVLEAAVDKPIRVRVGTDAASLDWNRASDAASGFVILQLMRGLNRMDANGEIKPDLATEWSYSKDRRTLTFRIRGDVKWSDGVKLKAKHFADSIERFLNPATAVSYASYLYEIEGAKDFNRGVKGARLGVSVEGDRILKIRLARPVTQIPSLLTHPSLFPVRKDLIEKHGAKWTEPQNLVVLGPYRLAERKLEKSLKLMPNESSVFHETGHLPIEILVLDEDVTALNLFDAGNLDLVLGIPSREVKQRQETLVVRSLSRVSGVLFNKALPALSDNRVRQALSMAVSRPELAHVIGGGQKENPLWLPIEMSGWDGKARLGYDPAGARKLLAAAGFADGAKLPKMTLIFPGRDDNALIAERIQAQLKENLGVAIELRNVEFKTFLATIASEPPAMIFFSWGTAFPDPVNFIEVFHSSGLANKAWSNSKFDELLEQGKVESDPEKKRKLLASAQDLLLKDDVAVLPIFNEVQRALVARDLRGYDLVGGRIYLENLRRAK